MPSWTSAAPIPTPVQGPTVQTLNGKIYVICGWILGGSYTKLVQMYDPVLNTWTNKAQFPDGTYLSQSAVVNGKIYVFGGVSTSYYEGLPDIYVYDPVADTWTALNAYMNTPVYAANAGVINGKIYVIGGQNYFGTGSLIQTFDPQTLTWTSKANTSFTIQSYNAYGVINNKLYIAGGNVNGTVNGATWEYDPAGSGTWTQKASAPSAVTDAPGVVLNNKLYVPGGYLSGGSSTTFYSYDPSTNIWSTEPSLPIGAYLQGAAVSGSSIYSISGTTGSNGLTANVYSINYNVLPTAPTSVVVSPTSLTSGSPLAISFTHNDPNGDAEAGHMVRSHLVGAPTWANGLTASATGISRTVDSDAAWGIGTLTNVLPSSNALVLASSTSTVFFDDFETFSGWTVTGVTFAASTAQKHSGSQSGLKSAGNDTAGKATKSLGTTLNSAWSAEVWVYDNSSSGGAQRWYLANGSDNGYGVYWNATNANPVFNIERRASGTGTIIAASSWTHAVFDGWLRIVFARDASGVFTLTVFDASGNSLGTPVTVTDTTYTGMTTFNVRGGAGPWYIDDITVSALTYSASGTRVASGLDLAAFSSLSASAISWTSTTPTGTTLTVETSVDGGVTWQAATSGSAISGAATGKKIQLRQTLTSTGANTPTLSTLTLSATGTNTGFSAGHATLDTTGFPAGSYEVEVATADAYGYGTWSAAVAFATITTNVYYFAASKFSAVSRYIRSAAAGWTQSNPVKK